MAHEHGSHECYCPTSGYSAVVDAGVACRDLVCPNGEAMRATDVGEYRGTPRGQSRYTSGIRAISQDSHVNLAWLLVPLLGVGLLFGVVKLSQTKME